MFISWRDFHINLDCVEYIQKVSIPGTHSFNIIVRFKSQGMITQPFSGPHGADEVDEAFDELNKLINS